jgi:tRNA (guanine37-N1)-methyltransferase
VKVDIVTIFPEFFESPLSVGTLRIAQEKKLLEVKVHNLRDYCKDPHRQVDDSPFGGGPGMVMKPEPFFEAVLSILEVKNIEDAKRKARIILLTPQGKTLNQDLCSELAKEERLVMLCGRYEGIDERVRFSTTDEISIGDYVLSGGEGAALVLLESVSRLIPGVLGEKESLKEESFSGGILEYPQYTRPREYCGFKVPEILLSGDHKLIARWRRREALKRTLERRPDLIQKASLSEDDLKILEELKEAKKLNH